jgi:hypothetical protein
MPTLSQRTRQGWGNLGGDKAHRFIEKIFPTLTATPWDHRGMRSLRLKMILLTAVTVCAPFSARGSDKVPCATSAEAETSGWRVYIDRNNRFCFRYPTSYVPVSHPKANCRGPKLEDRKGGANIGICVPGEDFDLMAIAKMAPTGIDSPPEPRVIGENTFYYYGPGGGGVSYPDGYYYNLRGKSLVIDFDGPYANDKTPTDEAKRMEQKVLATFRRF